MFTKLIISVVWMDIQYNVLYSNFNSYSSIPFRWSYTWSKGEKQ